MITNEVDRSEQHKQEKELDAISQQFLSVGLQYVLSEGDQGKIVLLGAKSLEVVEWGITPLEEPEFTVFRSDDGVQFIGSITDMDNTVDNEPVLVQEGTLKEAINFICNSYIQYLNR